METPFASLAHAYRGYVLLADDDEDDRSEMHHFFEENGHRAYFLTSGKATLNFLASLWPQQYPAVIILDYYMPGLSGEETLHKLKQSDAFWHIPVIIYSSEMTEALCKHLQSRGAFGCFAKSRQSDREALKHSLDALLHYTAAVA